MEEQEFFLVPNDSRPSIKEEKEKNVFRGYSMYANRQQVRELMRFTPQSTAGVSQRKGSIQLR